MFNTILISCKDNIKIILGPVGVFEELFSFRTNTSNIIKNILLQKTQHKKKSQQTKNNKLDVSYSITHTTIIVFKQLSDYMLTKLNKKIFFSNINLKTDIDYPLKIPFLFYIFLFLIIKMIFNVLPRSISITYNKIYIERACIV